MTVAERTRYINTFKAVYDDPGGQLKQHVDQHLRFFSRGLHNNGAFLPWHRACRSGCPSSRANPRPMSGGVSSRANPRANPPTNPHIPLP